MKQTLADRVVYTLSIPQASSQDSGTYECSITHEISGEVRVGSVAVSVFGKSLSAQKCFVETFLMSFRQKCNNVNTCLPP